MLNVELFLEIGEVVGKKGKFKVSSYYPMRINNFMDKNGIDCDHVTNILKGYPTDSYAEMYIKFSGAETPFLIASFKKVKLKGNKTLWKLA